MQRVDSDFDGNRSTVGEWADGEWADWYRLTPIQRWLESERLWNFYLECGGSLDPEPDTQSPFFDVAARSPIAADGRSGVRLLRRGGV
jgi:hypothetical protein